MIILITIAVKDIMSRFKTNQNIALLDMRYAIKFVLINIQLIKI